jgi:hypothetical protein
MEHLILIEERDKSLGFKSRIQQMTEVISDMRFYDMLESENRTREEFNKMVKDFHMTHIQQLLKNAPAGLLERIED